VLLAAVIGLSTGSAKQLGPATSFAPGDVTSLAEDARDDAADPSSSGSQTALTPRTEGKTIVRKVDPDSPEVTAQTIKVGITYTSDPGGANAAAGFTVGQVDQRRGWEALVANINKNAPFGRKIVPVWFGQTEDEVTSKGADRLGQEVCAKFTQDDPVFMVWVGTVGIGNTLSACLTKAKVPSIAFGIGESYSKTFQSYPYFVEPAAAALDRMAKFYVDALVGEGFFKSFKQNSAPFGPTRPADGKARIGLIRYDDPSHKAGASALKKRLATHRLALCTGCEFELTYSSTDVADQLDDATAANAAVQQCKSRGCTHVLFLGSAAQRIPVFFMDGAERQQYRPRLGLSPLDDPEFIKDFLGEPSHAQFRQAQSVTWEPAALGIKTAEAAACKKVFTDAGETFEGDEAQGKLSAIPMYCATADYFAAAAKSAGSVLNLDSWIKGVDTMDPIASSATYRMQTMPGRHDAVAAVQVGDWSDGCACFKPSSKVIVV
jgi:hypothetical protein